MRPYLALFAAALTIGCNHPWMFSKREWQAIQEDRGSKDLSTSGEIVHDGGVVLRHLIVPIIRDQEVVPIYTVQLFIMFDIDGTPKVGIVPKNVEDHSDWLWRDCHETSLWKSNPWVSAPNIARDDGHWLYVKATHKAEVDVASQGRYEWVSFRVSRDMLRELAAAEHSGGQVCNSKFEFSAFQKANIAMFTKQESLVGFIEGDPMAESEEAKPVEETEPADSADQ